MNKVGYGYICADILYFVLFIIAWSSPNLILLAYIGLHHLYQVRYSLRKINFSTHFNWFLFLFIILILEIIVSYLLFKKVTKSYVK